MILLFLLLLGLLLLSGLLWAGSAQTVRSSHSFGIIEAIPDTLEAEPSPPAGSLVILSYRLAYGLEPQRPDSPRPDAAMVCDRLDRIIETIAASGADIALLQEVDFASRRTCNIDQLYYMAAALGWGYAARAITWECRYLPWPLRQPVGPLHAGMGVISRYPLVQNVRHRLPQTRKYPLLATRFLPHYTVQMVDLQCGGTTLRLLHVYWDAQPSAVQQRQARALIAFVDDVYTPHSVLMGTFNSPPRIGPSGQDLATAQLTTALHDRFHLVAERGDDSPAGSPVRLAHALVGPALHGLETQVVAVDKPISEPLPVTLHLRWALPVV